MVLKRKFNKFLKKNASTSPISQEIWVDIKSEFENAAREEWQTLFEEYASDERSGVKNLILSYQKKQIAYEKELLRLETMLAFEKKYGDEYECICGIDEAGRGPLAGPVVAGAVVLPKNCKILYH